MKHIITAVCLFFIVYSTSAVFDVSQIGGNFNGVDLTRILECSEDGGGRFAVPFRITGRNDFNLPDISRFQSPGALRWASRNFPLLVALMEEFQGVDPTLQSLFQSNDSLNTDMVPPFQLCNRSTTDELDEDSGVFIVRNIINDTVTASGIDRDTVFFESNIDESSAIFLLFRAIRCDVVSRWNDLGETYLPRFAVSGRCFERNCSFPVGLGQMCAPDFSEIRQLPALRWDCCWEFDKVDGQTFECGWRREIGDSAEKAVLVLNELSVDLITLKSP